ncbi:MAG: hypothetical protein ACFCUL_13240 [Flavobacteriaceae bacterium]
MNMKKSAYETTPSGRILKYNVNYDTARFTFLPQREGSLFRKMLFKVNAILNDFKGTDFELDWGDIVQEYLKCGVGDVPHFAAQYVFADFQLRRRAHEKEVMEAIYIRITEGLNEEIEKGYLPG